MLLLLACSRASPEPDYPGALAQVSADPARARELCSPLAHDDLRADCLLAGAEALAASDPGAAAAICSAIDPGHWRDECGFQVAERSGGAVSCDGAGRYALDCRMHLWGWALEKEPPRPPVPGQVEAALAERMTAFGLDPAQDEPWWAAYRAVLSRQVPLDRASCDGAAEARLRRICREAGLQLYGDWLNHLRDTTGFPCEAEALTGRLVYAPDPELDALVARRRREDLCP